MKKEIISEMNMSLILERILLTQRLTSLVNMIMMMNLMITLLLMMMMMMTWKCRCPLLYPKVEVCLFWKVKMKMAFQFPSHKRVKLGIRSNKMN
uniref:Uncharacterized protein MANES_14G033300 n=1 Tax=Rhizophora mucronata TaxID=61149 RepID=A0A2P2JZG6_RHIMU